MYRAIIADDEIHVCLLLENLVNWKKLGIQIVGMYSDGIEAYEAIREKKPEIVITDIMMPGMNGLDIIKNCLNDKIDTTFLLISGHAEFEYAHMAIAYGVSNYLLKPINGKELESNLITICEKLEQKKQQSGDMENLQKKVHISEEALSKQFLNNYLKDPAIVQRQSLEELNQHYLLDLSDDFFQIVILKPTCKVSFTDQQITFLLKQLESYVVCEMKKYFRKVIAVCTELEVYFLLNGTISQNSVDVMKLIFSDISTAFFEYCYITLAVSAPEKEIHKLNLEDTRKLLMHRYNKGLNRIFSENDRMEQTENVNYKKVVNTLAGYISVFNMDGIDRLFLRLREYYRNDNVDIDNLLELVTYTKRILAESLEKLEKKSVDIRELDTEFSYMIRCSDTKKELFMKIAENIRRRLEKIKEKENIDNNRVIQIAKQYVEEHLAEKITLEDIANIVYMNPTYFSTLFKRETGDNFSDYLTNQRIEKAKEMLKSMNYSTQQVGELVGYENARYFSKVFLKVVGISPSEYRKYSKFL